MAENNAFAERVESEGLTINEQFDAYGKAVLPVLVCEFCGEKAASSEGKAEVVCIGEDCGAMMVDSGETITYEV